MTLKWVIQLPIGYDISLKILLLYTVYIQKGVSHGEITGSLSNHDGNSSKNITENKQVRTFSNFISLVPFHTICLMFGNSSGVDS